MESKYRIYGDKGHRAIMGLSMDGGGSTVYAQRHPEQFSSCYAMSAWLDNSQDEVWPTDSPKDCLYYVANAVREKSALHFIDKADESTLTRLRTVAWFIDCGGDDFLLDMNLALHWSLPFASRNFID